MSDMQVYKCPNCGGRVEFDSETQKLKCPFCDSVYDIDYFEHEHPEITEQELDIKDDYAWNNLANQALNDDDQIAIYQCQQCGGEIVTDKTTGATKCPYCDSPVVMVEKFADELKPDLVIPFKYDKKAAKQALKDYYKGKRLLPKVFTKTAHLEEIQSVYVPFWLYDADVRADAHYHATRTSQHQEGDYEVTETKHYDVYRAGNLQYNYLPVDGSTKFDDKMMESIEPFEMSEAVDFKTAYLSGYLADRYDVSVDESIKRANERLRNSVYSTLYSSVNGYSGVDCHGCNVQILDSHSHYALFPVWFLTTSWHDKKYYFAMNGQTGKVVGDLPVSWGLFFKYFILISLTVSVVLYLICALGIMIGGANI